MIRHQTGVNFSARLNPGNYLATWLAGDADRRKPSAAITLRTVATLLAEG